MKLIENYADVARIAWQRHIYLYPLDEYSSILSLHGMARLAVITDDAAILSEIKAHLQPFIEGKVEKVGGFYGEHVYRYGGNASAYMAAMGLMPEAVSILERQAENLCRLQSRDSRGIFDMPCGNWQDKSHGFLWIDTVFGVCPFLLWTGQASGRQEFIEESCFQMLKHYDILFDKTCNLYHQAINFGMPPDTVTPAHWSRGNGWAAIALTEMVYDLPREHQSYGRILTAYHELIEGCAVCFDDSGMLHQAMEDHSTYPETSGTALVLYAIGRGLKNGLLDKDKYIDMFLKGLKGLLGYISVDGSVFNCCSGCCAPGNGTVDDYAAHSWKLNDHHAFGPVILAFGQAQQLYNADKIPALNKL
ncbi:MAG: glycoside hydrolase family 88 protein [Victivallales bacterium]|nr:glycoside hydrolase family 88 protein [Victivallales bacterium]